MPHESLYKLIGLPDFATAKAVKEKLAALQESHGPDFSKGVSSSHSYRLKVARQVLLYPEAKQRYELLLHAETSGQTTLPRFGSEQEGREVVALAKLLNMELEKVGPQTFLIRNRNEPNNTRTSIIEETIELGKQTIDFLAIPFLVGQPKGLDPIEIHLQTTPPTRLTLNLDHGFLSPSDTGTLVVAKSLRTGQRPLIAACANHTTGHSMYIEQAADILFTGSVAEIARDFGVRAKLARIQELTVDFHRLLSRFVMKVSPDFQDLGEDNLVNYIKQRSYLFNR